jgi:hypothetical protein
MPAMSSRITVPRRFCGPPESGNGGYVCGLLAGAVDGDAEVTLRMPPPLERELVVEARERGAVLRDGDDVIAEAVPAQLEIAVPAAVSFADATRAAAASRFLTRPETHPFPTCFVCGPHREERDGLRLFASGVGDRDLVAAGWVPDPSLPRAAADESCVATEIVWSALDCPGVFSMYLEPELEGPYVLGRLAAHIATAVRVGEEYVVMGWRAGIDGRKLFTGSAVYDANGTPVAYARATWVQLRPTTSSASST